MGSEAQAQAPQMGAAAADPVQPSIGQALHQLLLVGEEVDALLQVGVAQPLQPRLHPRSIGRGGRLSARKALHGAEGAEGTEGPGEVDGIDRQARLNPAAVAGQQVLQGGWRFLDAAAVVAGQLRLQQDGEADQPAIRTTHPLQGARVELIGHRGRHPDRSGQTLEGEGAGGGAVHHHQVGGEAVPAAPLKLLDQKVLLEGLDLHVHPGMEGAVAADQITDPLVQILQEGGVDGVVVVDAHRQHDRAVHVVATNGVALQRVWGSGCRTAAGQGKGEHEGEDPDPPPRTPEHPAQPSG